MPGKVVGAELTLRTETFFVQILRPFLRSGQYCLLNSALPSASASAAIRISIRARLIDAECTRIDDAEELVLRDDGGRSDLGYPEGALLDDGTAFVAYYFNHKSDGGNQRYVAATVVSEK